MSNPAVFTAVIGSTPTKKKNKNIQKKGTLIFLFPLSRHTTHINLKKKYIYILVNNLT